MKNMNLRKVSVVLLALLLAAMVMVPMVSAKDKADISLSKENAIASILPNITKEDHNWILQRDILAVSGIVPEAMDSKSQETQQAALKKTLKSSSEDLKELLYPEGPVIALGIDYLGCIPSLPLKE
jgi:hypothetical protein